jgi:hypothetical protein
VLFPTLVALLGFRIERNPCTADYVKFRIPNGIGDVTAALQRSDAFWMHPVSRHYADPVRTRIRQAHGEYHKTDNLHRGAGQWHSDQLWPILQRMWSIEGWLGDEEAELLAIAVRETIKRRAGPKTIVEIGSFCGKATFVLASVAKSCCAETRIIAVDTFDGIVGALDRDLIQCGPTLEKFKRLLHEAGLSSFVETHISRAWEAPLEHRVDFLVVDGLHDYASVARDFYAFEASLPVDALIAFHDYADYFPGVRDFVDELLNEPERQEMAQAGSMKLLRRQALPLAALPPSEA